MADEIKIMGIDPGLAALGWGIIAHDGYRIRIVDYGAIRTKNTIALAERLSQIHTRLQEICAEYKPNVLAIEELFFSSNQLTAMQVAQARGVAILAFAKMGIKIYEYSPLAIKKSIVGYGRATKDQVKQMLVQLLSLEKPPKPTHAADAIAAALCHLNHQRLKRYIPVSK